MTFSKGDIVWPQNRTRDKNELFHPAIVWEDKTHGDSDFIGIMLTGSAHAKGHDNISMSVEHFSTEFNIPSKPSYFVNQKFIKFASWGPFEKVGKLTTEGIEFIKEKISSASPIPFDTYTNGSKI